MNENQNRMYNNATMLKALEEVDKDKAIEAISNPNLDGKELSELLECSMLGKIVNKHTNEPMKFSNDVLMAGLRNKLNQVIRDAESE
jgi:hypothetical protein